MALRSIDNSVVEMLMDREGLACAENNTKHEQYQALECSAPAMHLLKTMNPFQYSIKLYHTITSAQLLIVEIPVSLNTRFELFGNRHAKWYLQSRRPRATWWSFAKVGGLSGCYLIDCNPLFLPLSYNRSSQTMRKVLDTVSDLKCSKDKR